MNQHYPLPKFSASLRDQARSALRLGAKWHASVQQNQAWPHWRADSGRFSSSHTLNGSKQDMLSICWNTSRGAQACLSAYTVLKDESILETVKKAMEYVKLCQVFVPEYPHHHGAFLEETPQTDHIASRDSVEALQGFVNTYVVTQDLVYLQRAIIGADWWYGWFMEHGYPNGYIWHKYENDRGSVNNDFSRIMLGAVSLVFSQLDTLLDQKKYTLVIPRLLDWIVDVALEPDGALKIHDGTDVGHHAIQHGPYANCFTNDDGAMISLMAAYRVTGNEKYKEAALRNANWWLKVDTVVQPYASTPAILLNLLDFYRFTGNDAFLEKSEDYIEKVLALQIKDSEDSHALGGFRGHDYSNQKEIDYFDGIDPYDIVSHRTTMYAMLSLAKVAAEDESQWNLAYSAFGW